MFPFAALASSFLPSLFGGMFGRGDPRAKLRQQLMQLYSPGNISNQTNLLYRQFLGSPAYSQAQGQIAGSSNALSNALNQSLGARGLSTSGIGSIAKPIAANVAGGRLAGLQSEAYQNALRQAMEAIQNQGNALQGVGPSPNYGAQLFGAGLENFAPYLQQFLSGMGRKAPGSLAGYV